MLTVRPGEASWAPVLLLLCVAALAATLGCSSLDTRRDHESLGAAAGAGAAAGDPTCQDEGAARDCGVHLAQAGSVISCYRGSQTCTGGRWTDCGGGSVVGLSLAGLQAPGGLFSLSAPDGCENNPCDPSCWRFVEEPDGGMVPDAGSASIVWPGGSLDSFPGGLVSKALREPCQWGFDCQFNHRCQHPVTGAACSHSKCVPGAGLEAGCDPCVDAICDIEPDCCAQPYVHSCSHDLCETGRRLKANCDDCVATLCDHDSYCCSPHGSWDWICVDEVQSICGLGCPLGDGGSEWTRQCADMVGTVCNADCGTPTPSTCEHSVCDPGEALDTRCHSCAQAVCDRDPACCILGWDQSCVARVPSECDLSCPVEMIEPPPDDGACVPWLPSQTSEDCSGVDLGGGIVCDEGIPVCNHGTTTAPAGIRVVHFAGNSQQYPKCDPDLSHPSLEECFTDKPIPPGQCIAIENCPGLSGNREIMINPPGPNHVPECNCNDNWTLRSNGVECVEPVCSGGSSETVLTSVNLLFVVDRSGSMKGNKWAAATGALEAIASDPDSAGLNVALEFFPLQSNHPYHDGCAGNFHHECDPEPCSNPMVPLGELTQGASPDDGTERDWVNAIGSLSPGGFTPTFPALSGALKWASDRKADDPKGFYSVILVTDGEPTQCETSTYEISRLSLLAYSQLGIKTYTIGMEGADISALNVIAQGGGTGSAFFVSDGAGSERQLIDVFQAIARQNARCTLPIDNANAIEPRDGSVLFGTDSSAAAALAQLDGPEACGDGWYYDDPVHPTTVTLCPDTCDAVQSDDTSTLRVGFGCKKPYAETTRSEIYQADCPDEMGPQWGFLTWDTRLPEADSSIVFRVRTAATEAGLAAATYREAGSATLAPDTQVCALFGPAPACPVVLYPLLGERPDAHYPYLELEMTLLPGSDEFQAPLLNDWEITYSCTFNE